MTVSEPFSIVVEHVAAGGFCLRAALEVGIEPVALIGPNGSGKSTFLLAVLGIRVPHKGRIALARDVLFDSEAQIDCPTEERHLAYLPQDFGLFPFMTVQENVEFAMACQLEAPTRNERRRAAMACLDRFGVAHLADRPPDQLSGGERQRVALARAIASRPRALLLDEPTASLDIEARTDVRLLLAATLRDLEIPALIVTHDLGDILALAGRVAVMDSGRIVACTDLAEARRSPPNPFAARLLAQPESTGTLAGKLHKLL